MRLRDRIRSAAPTQLRVSVARVRRAWRDRMAGGQRPRFSRRAPAAVDGFQAAITVVQEIKRTQFAGGKLANLHLGAARLDGIVLQPGETLSFWKLVGTPSTAAGFKVGRSIRGGTVQGEVGGGLCQLSGIAYEAGLRAGLAIAERHPHSRDLYAEEDRFAPLGLDATVVWPYKDLRLRNALAVPVQFRFAVTDMTVVATILAPTPLEPATLDIARTEGEGRRAITVTRRSPGGARELISEDSYLVES